MIENLVVTGCSFTARVSWADHVAEYFQVSNYYNEAHGGAGNFYLANSIVDLIETWNFNPETTLVLVMWSGLSRKDLRVSQQYFDLLQNYGAKRTISDNFYVFSGGMSNSWLGDPLVKKAFYYLYQSSDYRSLICDSLSHIIQLQNYLKNKNYRYKFLSFMNFWCSQKVLPVDKDLIVANYFPMDEIERKIDFNDWIFVNQHRDCLYEYAANLDFLLKDRFHPDSRAQASFAEHIVIPSLLSSFSI